MFEPQDKPRVFYLPPGVDFSRVFCEGYRARQPADDPIVAASGQIWVNTSRTAHRMREIFAEARPTLIPDVQVIDALSQRPIAGVRSSVSRLERTFEIAAVMRRLIAADPTFANPAAVFDLSDSVARLFAEMTEERVDFAALEALDVTDQSGHWQRALKFLSVLAEHVTGPEAAPDGEGRQRAAAEALIARWQVAPPTRPTVIAGTTGSRGTTFRLMQAVAGLPLGAVVLPGLDPNLPASVWRLLGETDAHPDHPQYRFARFLAACGLDPRDVPLWHDASVASEARNRLISLALRPPPLTDRWIAEVDQFEGLEHAVADIALISAENTRLEAISVALALRQAAADGLSGVLVTPDRTLARRVAQSLQSLGLDADDTAGRPLGQTPVGRLLKQIAGLVSTEPSAERLIALLKHPLVAASGRAEHLARTRALELTIRAKRLVMPTREDLEAVAGDDDWTRWLAAILDRLDPHAADVATHVTRLIELATELYRGPLGATDNLWDSDDGREARAMIDRMLASGMALGRIAPFEFVALLNFVFARGQVRAHPARSQIRIIGTIDARIMSADLVVLAGLNEGVWPGAPGFDPWLNRAMRRDLGLRAPDAETGLSAHDFQQAISAPRVILSRSLRSGDAETVPSRWLNRLTTVLGPDRTRALIAKGDALIRAAEALERPDQAEKLAVRPAPIPPQSVRPRRLSVTEIERLSRDPYAIYARHILSLRKLEPLRKLPDARDRGTVQHQIMEDFVQSVVEDPSRLTRENLIGIANQVLARDVPWEIERLLWLRQFEAIADWLVATETEFQASGKPVLLEGSGTWRLSDPDFTLVGKADRIDATDDGARIIDYKTTIPSGPARDLAQQLPLEALMFEAGAFDGVTAGPAAGAVYVALNKSRKIDEAELTADQLQDIKDRFISLIRHYLGDEAAFQSRRLPAKYPGDFDHLARLGEWQDSDPPVSEALT